ncbi:MAG: glycine cleavage system protein GcvH [Bacteroidales bacterium]|nr:glycine cleavage system protein GcvH [Bacteroidales bacterium]MDY2917019.1 glycine cleavage system protein GcvH [Muribaculaceae bacterium]
MIKYLPTHEYARIEGNEAYIGISPYAAHQLGNVVYVDMPEVDDTLVKDEEFGAIESVKAASDLFAPLSGTVTEVNEALVDNPRLVSDDPMKNWIIKIEISDPKEVEQLLDQEAYDAICDAEHKE